MLKLIRIKWHNRLEHFFPEKRIFLRTDTQTRFIRLGAARQIMIWLGFTGVIAWSIVATALVAIHVIDTGKIIDHPRNDQTIYEERLNALAQSRDNRAQEALVAHNRFNAVLAQVSRMQTEILSLQKQRTELENGLKVLQTTLQNVVRERNQAQLTVQEVRSTVDASSSAPLNKSADILETLTYMTAALTDAAERRDAALAKTHESTQALKIANVKLQSLEERNIQIFRQLEEALNISVEPLTKMFNNAGINPNQLIQKVRSGYSGLGGLAPLSFVPNQNDHIDHHARYANDILNKMSELNLYRIAVDQTPLSHPIKDNFRYTSGFGMRWGRPHNGIDMAAPHRTPIYATADGVVTRAGWYGAYGRVVYIKHANNTETRYAHLAKIRVKKGQKVSRGKRIGDMGNSGRSTGTHLHYEIRVNGRPINPMKYIKAAQNVL